MHKTIIDFLPNVHKCVEHVLLFHNYHLIEEYPSSLFSDVSTLFSDVCSMFDFELPSPVQFAYFRSPFLSIKVKDYGEYQLIIFKPLKSYEQNSNS